MTRLILALAALACVAQAAQTPDASALRDSEKELFAARYAAAVRLYQDALKTHPAEFDAYYGLVRALIGDHRAQEAYAAAEEALQKNPQKAGVQTAAGLAAFRGGDLRKAESHFRSALRFDSGYAGALMGLAAINEAVSNFKTARSLLLTAYRISPGDPELMIEYANTLKGAEHIAALQKALPILDPESEQGRYLRAHIANDLAVRGRKLRQLASPYETTRVKLFRIMNGPSSMRGVGVRVQLNQKHSVRLLLDTGASGISVSPKATERAGLELLGDQASDMKGIGDEQAQASYRYMASELQIGSVTFSNYPVAVFRSAKSADFDGLIGADVFRKFIVTIDFPRLELILEPRTPGGSPVDEEDPTDASPLAAGFYRAIRCGNHLAVPTSINDGRASLFLLDSGGSTNIIDTAIGKQWTKVSKDDGAQVKGIQGTVKQASRANDVHLVFAGFRQDNPTLIAISLEKMNDSMGVAFGGILGMPVLGKLKMTIDYREGAVRLEYVK